MHRLLIANRGEIARRIQRTCRGMGLASVAVYSEPDREALFVRESEEAVALGGASSAESYLRIDKLLEAARRTGCDAVHPGYGFLAENAEFARRCGEAGLIFVGPRPETIEAMGSKTEAKRTLAAAGVPMLDTVEIRTTSTPAVERLTWPLLVKAVAGGGGRGMRIVRRAEDLDAAVAAAAREAESAFGDASVFLEPYLEGARHVEIQIFGDAHGQIAHLFERECSIQRRHQKLIEESPSPALDEPLRGAMVEAALRAARAIGYTSAGTVEFLLADDGRFYFLEVNTRLQVEHPVTECLTGLDLVRLQLEVAAGAPLPREALEARTTGHAIEVRLCAEDPASDFLPVSGRLHRFRIPESPGLRVDSGFADGCNISPHYDSLLAKVVAHATTRREAAAKLARALRGAEIHGLRTNRELLVRVLEHPEFLAGRTDTQFLVRDDAAALGAPLLDTTGEALHAVAAALAGAAERRESAAALRSIPAGWRNNPSQPQEVRFAVGDRERQVAYRLARGKWSIQVDGVELDSPRVEAVEPERVALEAMGVLRRYRVHRVGASWYVDSPLGSCELREIDRFPASEPEIAGGSLVAPLPGVVDEVKVAVGANVESGDVLLVIESMKMLHRVCAPHAGRVTELRVAAKTQVQAGAVLAVITEA